MVKVYFETSSYCHQVAIFDDEETYAACTPALEELMKKHNFEFMSESVEEEEANRSLSKLPDSALLSELERRGYAVRTPWCKDDVQSGWQASDEVAMSILFDVLNDGLICGEIHNAIAQEAESKGLCRKKPK